MYNASESDGEVNVMLSLQGQIDIFLEFSIEIIEGSATRKSQSSSVHFFSFFFWTEDNDYHQQEVQVPLEPPLMDSVVITIQLRDDMFVESKEKFFLRIIVPSSSQNQISVTGPIQAQVYIINDDRKHNCFKLCSGIYFLLSRCQY